MLCLGLIQVPVGRATLGRIMNVIGEPIDEKGELSTFVGCNHFVFGISQLMCISCCFVLLDTYCFILIFC